MRLRNLYRRKREPLPLLAIEQRWQADASDENAAVLDEYLDKGWDIRVRDVQLAAVGHDGETSLVIWLIKA